MRRDRDSRERHKSGGEGMVRERRERGEVRREKMYTRFGGEHERRKREL